MQIVAQVGGAPGVVRDRDPRPPAEGPAGHDRPRRQLPAARVQLLLPADRGLAAVHRRHDAAAAVEPAPAFGALAPRRRRRVREHPTSVPPGGYASPEREAAFPSAPTPLPTAAEPETTAGRDPSRPSPSGEPPVDEPPASEAPTEVGRPAPEPAGRDARADARTAVGAGPAGADLGRSARRQRAARAAGARAEPAVAGRLARRARRSPARPRRATGPTPSPSPSPSLRRAPTTSEDEPPPGPLWPELDQPRRSPGGRRPPASATPA